MAHGLTVILQSSLVAFLSYWSKISSFVPREEGDETRHSIHTNQHHGGRGSSGTCFVKHHLCLRTDNHKFHSRKRHRWLQQVLYNFAEIFTQPILTTNIRIWFKIKATSGNLPRCLRVDSVEHLRDRSFSKSHQLASFCRFEPVQNHKATRGAGSTCACAYWFALRGRAPAWDTIYI